MSGSKPDAPLLSEPLPAPSIKHFCERGQQTQSLTQSSIPSATPKLTRSASTLVSGPSSSTSKLARSNSVLVSAPPPVSEEDAQREATKLTEEICKVKGTVVVPSSALPKASNMQQTGLLGKSAPPIVPAGSVPPEVVQGEAKGGPSIQSGLPAQHIPSPVPAQPGTGAASPLPRSVSVSPTPIIASSPNPAYPTSDDKSADTFLPEPSSHHIKQPSVHAHFLLEEVVGHTGVRSRSGSNSMPAPPVIPGQIVGRAKLWTEPQHSIPSLKMSNSGAPNSNVASTAAPNPRVPSVTNLARELNKPVDARAGLTELTNDGPGLSQSGKENVAGKTGPSKPEAPSLAVTLPLNADQPAATKQTVPAGTGDISTDPRLPQDDGKLHVLLAATGSISTGKLRLIISKLKEIYGPDRLSVQIILTKAAENFVSRGEIPSHVRIWRDQDEWATWKSRADPVVHIELRRWADILVIAPLSANTLGKIALGLCDNLLTNVVRAWNTQYPILVAPSMVSYAYNNPATRRHLQVIKEEMGWIEVLKPVEKVVGSYGDIGMGGMMDWNEIVNRIVLKLGGYPEDEDENENDDDDNGDDSDDYDDSGDEENYKSAQTNHADDKRKKAISKLLQESQFDDDDLDMVIKKLSLADRENLTARKKQPMDM